MCGILVELSAALCASPRYAGNVGRVIRRTITITVTITETLAIVWTPEDAPVYQMAPDSQVQLQTQEKQDETAEKRTNDPNADTDVVSTRISEDCGSRRGSRHIGRLRTASGNARSKQG